MVIPAAAVHRRQKMKEETYECEVKSQFLPMEASNMVISAAAAYRRQKMKEKTYEVEAQSQFMPMEALNVVIPAAAAHRRHKMKEKTYECVDSATARSTRAGRAAPTTPLASCDAAAAAGGIATACGRARQAVASSRTWTVTLRPRRSTRSISTTPAMKSPMFGTVPQRRRRPRPTPT